MKCPKCSFNVSDKKNSCPRCHLDLKKHKQRLGIAIHPSIASHGHLKTVSLQSSKEEPKKKSSAGSQKKTDTWVSRLLKKTKSAAPKPRRKRKRKHAVSRISKNEGERPTKEVSESEQQMTEAPEAMTSMELKTPQDVLGLDSSIENQKKEIPQSVQEPQAVCSTAECPTSKCPASVESEEKEDSFSELIAALENLAPEKEQEARQLELGEPQSTMDLDDLANAIDQLEESPPTTEPTKKSSPQSIPTEQELAESMLSLIEEPPIEPVNDISAVRFSSQKDLIATLKRVSSANISTETNDSDKETNDSDSSNNSSDLQSRVDTKTCIEALARAVEEKAQSANRQIPEVLTLSDLEQDFDKQLDAYCGTAETSFEVLASSHEITEQLSSVSEPTLESDLTLEFEFDSEELSQTDIAPEEFTLQDARNEIDIAYRKLLAQHGNKGATKPEIPQESSEAIDLIRPSLNEDDEDTGVNQWDEEEDELIWILDEDEPNVFDLELAGDDEAIYPGEEPKILPEENEPKKKSSTCEEESPVSEVTQLWQTAEVEIERYFIESDELEIALSEIRGSLKSARSDLLFEMILEELNDPLLRRTPIEQNINTEARAIENAVLQTAVQRFEREERVHRRKEKKKAEQTESEKPRAPLPTFDTASLFARSSAAAIDGLVAISAGLSYLVFLVVPEELRSGILAWDPFVLEQLLPYSFDSLAYILSTWLILNTCSVATNGKTFGHGLLNLKLVSRDGSAVSFSQSLARCLNQSLCLLSCGCSFALHDMLAGTLTIKEE